MDLEHVLHLPLLHLTIPGDPVSQGNPQTFRGGGVAYPKATVNHRAYVETALAHYWRMQPPITEPVALYTEFHFARPAAHYGTGRNAALLKASAPKYHAQQPDTDKLLRLVMDSLTKAAVWADDRLAGRVTGEKHWTQPGFGPRTEITIYQRSPMDISEGPHLVTLTCPECEAEVRMPIGLTARLTVDAATGGKLRPVLSSKATQHNCDGAVQERFVFVGEPKDSE